MKRFAVKSRLRASFLLFALFLFVMICAERTKARAGVEQGSVLQDFLPFINSTGVVQTYSTNGDVDFTGPFFQSLGTNGRSCGSCHKPDQGWTISADGVSATFRSTQGLDPLFRTNDGSVCDHDIDTSTLESRKHAYSLLISRGLIRVTIKVPGNAEFTVVNVNNPYGCNETDAISLYRRPLPSANLRFLSAVMWDGRESSPQTGTQKITYEEQNPGAILLANLSDQVMNATLGHAQAVTAPTQQQTDEIVKFETGLFTAQGYDFKAGPLYGHAADGASGGPAFLARQTFFVGLNDPIDALGLDRPDLGFNPFHSGFTPNIFDLFESWSDSHPADSLKQARASIARGEVIFNSKPINIAGVIGLNDELGIPVVSGTCGTCHDTPNAGNHSFPTPLNIGTGDLSNPLDVAYLPVITLQNNTSGQLLQTTDPGRALITGKWNDVGKVKGPVLRALASRAPYFHNGSAATLRDAVEFYNHRFGIGFTDAEKADLIAFLNAL